MKKKFYLSTAIAYASAIPHIGNVYEAILSDAICRFKRLEGYEVYFQTGTDDHGQKIEANAHRQNLTPQGYVDMIANEIKRIYDLVDVSYDQFIRTTNDDHKTAVANIFEELLKQGDVYLGKYQGWYSVADEAFISESDIVDGKGPSGDIPVWTQEDSYFLKLSKYQKRLMKHIEQNPNFILPESRKNEIMANFLSQELPDLSISRTSFKWGIPIKSNPEHVIYVWIDALSNYITGLGYDPTKPKTSKFNEFWPADVQVIGKDIIRFHTIYWPIILMALNLELPKTIFAHPWILVDRSKMSKSVGNTLYTDELVKHYGVDVVRYYVLHEIPYAQDGNITHELVMERSNSDLANTIGNLVNRTIGMINKYQDGLVIQKQIPEPFEYGLKDLCEAVLPKIRTLIDQYKVGDALEEIMILARAANKYVDLSEPWNLKKNNDLTTLSHVMYSLVETIRYIAVLLQPFIPQTAKQIFEQINTDINTFDSLKKFGQYPRQAIGQAKVLFERFDINKKIEEIVSE